MILKFVILLNYILIIFFYLDYLQNKIKVLMTNEK